MKIFGMAVGLAALLAAGSARAAVVYDTINGSAQSLAIASRDSLSPINAANRGPLGDSFVLPSQQWITAVALRLRNKGTVGTTDNGGMIVYLVQDNGSGVPKATGTSLTSPILLGTIADNLVPAMGTAIPAPAGAFQNVVLKPHVLVAPGTYWIEVVDAVDPLNNGSVVTSFTDPSSLKWGLDGCVTCTGVPANPADIVSYQNSTGGGLVAYNSLNDPFAQASPANGTTAGEVFELQIKTPEPATLAILGAGLLGLGLSRRRRGRKTAG